MSEEIEFKAAEGASAAVIESGQGRIYVLQGRYSGNLKIGFTTRLSDKRRRELQTGSHEELDLVGLYPGEQVDERIIHLQARRYALHGKWFSWGAAEVVERHFRGVNLLDSCDRALADSAPLFRGLKLDRIPAAICIPLDDGDTIYRPIRRSTIGELREAVRARRKQIADNVAVADRMIELLDLRLSQGASDDDFVLPDDPPSKRAA